MLSLEDYRGSVSHIIKMQFCQVRLWHLCRAAQFSSNCWLSLKRCDTYGFWLEFMRSCRTSRPWPHNPQILGVATMKFSFCVVRCWIIIKFNYMVPVWPSCIKYIIGYSKIVMVCFKTFDIFCIVKFLLPLSQIEETRVSRPGFELMDNFSTLQIRFNLCI